MNTKKVLAGSLLVVGLVGMGLGISQNTASANNGQGENENQIENKSEQKNEAHKKGTTLEVHINDNGTVLVRGAKVTSVSGTVINATTAWGSANLNWQVSTNSGTHYMNKNGGSNSLSGVTVGDFLSFNGAITSSTNGSFAVTATNVKDWSSSITPVNMRTTVEGMVKSAALGIIPTNFMLTVNGKDYTVRVAVDTAVINNNWLRTAVSTLRVGDQVRVYGMVNSDNTIDATVVRDVSLK